MRIETNFKETEIWKIPMDWEVVKIQDYINFIRWVEPWSNNYNLDWIWHRFIRVADLWWNNRETFTDIITDKICSDKDILVSLDWSLWIIAKWFKWCYSSWIRKIKVNENKVNHDFTYYILLSSYFQEVLHNNANGAVIKHWSNALKFIQIPLPTISEQEKIADFLWTIDDKIALNNSINKKLEETAQALFKSRFIDFEPFKDWEFIDSEMGKIPKGWRVEIISNLFEVKDWTHDSPKQSSKWKFLVTSKHIWDNYIDFTNAYYISECDYTDINKRSKVDTNDILLSMIWTIWNLILVKNEIIDFAIKNIWLFKTSQRSDLTEYIYMYLKSNYWKWFILNNLSWSTQQYITLKSLRSIPVIIPNDNILNKYVLNVKLFFEIINSNIIQNQKLTEIKKYFLPKLISGEIRLVD